MPRTVETQLAEYEAVAKEVYEMLPGDERAECIRIMSQILDKIIKVDYRLLKKRPVDELLKSIENLYLTLPKNT